MLEYLTLGTPSHQKFVLPGRRLQKGQDEFVAGPFKSTPWSIFQSKFHNGCRAPDPQYVPLLAAPHLVQSRSAILGVDNTSIIFGW